jgi:hypothetical protein
VKRLEVLDLFELAEAFSVLSAKLATDKVGLVDLYFSFSTLEGSLKKFDGAQGAFNLSRDSAREALTAIKDALDEHIFETPAREKFKEVHGNEISTWLFWNLKAKLQEFRHVFSAECRKSETYFIEKKIGFDISTLLHSAEENLHDSIRPCIPQAALTELREAGRCLALESYTASGFHTLRGLEVVMGAYYRAVSTTEKEFRSWHDYVEALEELAQEKDGIKPKYPSPKVASMLDRMRQLDRNPLMHPSDTLDEMAADTLFKLGIVTITELAKDLRDMAGQTELKLVTSDAAAAE